MLNKDISRKAGMSMVEVMISLSIASVIALGSASSAILFAKIANAHENRAEFHRDVRNGFEQLAFDTRNSNGVASRGGARFVLSFNNSSNVVYRYNATDKKVERKEGNSVRTVFSNVTKFDILKDDSDSNSTLTYDKDEISIESLEFEKHNGSMPDSKLQITDFTFKIRNS